MRVADFFCGGGGFSEGFREAGFDVVLAVDLWKTAVESHHYNHPECNTVKMNVEDISLMNEVDFEEFVPDTEVIIGSPPCVAFSNSNKSGNADKGLGIRLVEAYLRIVYRKLYKENSELKYWVLENVPNLKKYIKTEYSGSDLEIDEELYGISSKKVLKVIFREDNIYNAKYYGVPSNRKRFICGNFPEPVKLREDNNLITLGEVLTHLGTPDLEKKHPNETIDDMFNGFKMKSKDITDHHYIQHVPKFQWVKAKRAKEDKGYMGKMAFPENLDKPSRTIMATMSLASREAMIFGYEDGFRAPTIREIATLMSYPLDYRFCGSSIESKYRLVGNSVPPKMSYAIAKAIANKLVGRSDESNYILIGHKNSDEFYNLNYTKIPMKIQKDKNFKSKYKYHIPYFKINTFRVELNNHRSDFENSKFVWEAEIHKSQGPNAEIHTISKEALVRSLPDKLVMKLDNFVSTYCTEHLKGVSFYRLQMNYIEVTKKEKGKTPDDILFDIKAILSKYEFEKEEVFVKKDENMKYPKGIIIGYYILQNIIEYIGGNYE
ncbi:MAG: DNA cytosine methyltransferase [Firmicutes bacterium HGW-Firmicutes-5]|nr:MAG: DNA cytosine methyltransferase [Firmicutes bacterium HGW-Firmicutes-5]